MTDAHSSVPREVSAIDWDRWVPDDVATLLFVIRDGQILLIRKKRGLGAGKVNGPGGRLDPGETPLQAAIREIQEELVITPSPPREVGQHRFQFLDGYSLHVHVFVSDDFEGVPTETDEAIPLWVGLDEIPYDEMWADDVLWIPLMLAGTRFEGWWVFDDDVMLSERLVALD